MTNKKRILVVDDEKELVELIKNMLELRGYEVIFAYDGDEGLRKAKVERPDLIILDLRLPKIEGYRVCSILKLDEGYKRIPILILSALSDEDDKTLGMKVGADAYLTKPHNDRELLSTIEKLLNKNLP